MTLYPGTGFTNIPSSSVFLPSSLPGSPFTVEVVESICGDRIKTGPETWDDCNTLDGDGCSSSCYVEDGWTCTGGSPTTYDTCTEVCGDGKRFNYLNIYWDDGNPNDRDGCSFNWAIERGWYCFGGSTTSPDVCREICSNGIRFNSDPTYWDDGNLIDGDGCSSSWSVEYDFTCSGGSSNSQDFWKEICGDGVRVSTSKTYWDDGNTKSEDGWSSTWSIEVGYIRIFKTLNIYAS